MSEARREPSRCSGFLLLSLLVLFLLNQRCHGSVADRLTLGESLSAAGGDKRSFLISQNGAFKLGFFNLTASAWYLGIWYSTVANFTVAWVANRQNSIPQISISSALLTLDANGNLHLSVSPNSSAGSAKASIWSTANKFSSKSVPVSSAVLRNDGNLMILGQNAELLWQSLDEPGDTWLPGMKLGHYQNRVLKLTSWRSPTDPNFGPYQLNLQIDSSGLPKFTLTHKSSPNYYWDTGVWNGQFFQKVPEMAENDVFHFKFNNSGYFTFSATSNILSRLHLRSSGQMRVYALGRDGEWMMFCEQPRSACDVFGLCGNFATCTDENIKSCDCIEGFSPAESFLWNEQDWSGGCARKTPLVCESSPRLRFSDNFLQIFTASLPRAESISQNAGVLQRDCRANCLRNCSCSAYSMAENGTCLHWFGGMFNFRKDGLKRYAVFLRMNAKDVSGRKSSGVRVTPICVTVAALLSAVGASAIFIIHCRRRRRNRIMARKSTSLSEQKQQQTLRVFSYKDLVAATNNFANRLGRGGFGSVYSGILPDGIAVAVKILEQGISGSSLQGEKQFRTEVSTIGNIHHMNLVRLYGFCCQGGHRLLVYELMPNGCVAALLARTQLEEQPVDWKTRFDIIVGTARALAYLHEQCRECIIHCDIKPENILLDDQFQPKIADFGLAKILGRNFSQVLTTFRGTRGYLAPEWLSGSPITAKADVYSFGMTVLELLSGQRNIAVANKENKEEKKRNIADANKGNEEEEQVSAYFPAWACVEVNRGNSSAVLDSRLQGQADEQQVKRAATVAAWCIQDDECMRPCMKQVLQILQGVADLPAELPPVPALMQFLLPCSDSSNPSSSVEIFDSEFQSTTETEQSPAGLNNDRS